MAARKTRVVIIGESIFLAGVQALLEKTPGVEVLAYRPGVETEGLPVMVDLLRLQPDVLVYHAEGEAAQFILTAFHHHPEICLIGLEWEEQRAIVVQGHAHRLVDAGDLNALILRNA